MLRRSCSEKETGASEVIILGAGASANFTPTKTPFEGLLFPFPMVNNFFQKAIEHSVMKDRNVFGQPMHKALLDFIGLNFSLTFEELKTKELSVEEVYTKLERSITKFTRPNGEREELDLYLAKTDLLDLIEELLCKLSRHYGPCKYHSILAKNIVQNESVVISFNWDTLIDEGLCDTRQWFYETGYGIKFKRVYINKIQTSQGDTPSKGLLLKPHGSINWFRYRDFYSSDTKGFTAEPVSEDERKDTFLSEYFKTTPPRMHPIQMRLAQGKDYKPLLKMPAEIDIVPPIPPGEKNKLIERPAFKLTWDKVKSSIENAKSIIAIGYALKEPYIIERFRTARINSARSLALILVNKAVNNPQFVKHYREVFNPDRIEPFDTLENYCGTLE